MKKIIKTFVLVLLISLLFPFYIISEKKKLKTPDVVIIGPVLMADGIGRQTAELAEYLAKEYKVKIVPDHFDTRDLLPSTIQMVKAKYNHKAPIAIVESSLWSPGDSLDRFFPDVDNKYQIRYAYSMLESTRIPPEWVLMINLYFDAVIVPDIFLVEAYKQSGVAVPIFHIPLGLDLESFLQSPLKAPKTEGPLLFACLGGGVERKNHKVTIQAFAKALGNNENARLHINCRQAQPEVRQEIISEIIRQKCNNIQYTELCLKKDAYLKFFKSIDCLLSFSKGEGFSIQPREAMALGIPVIVTDNTAQSTICKSGLAKIVTSAIPEPRYYFNKEINDGEHYNCSVDEAADAIKDVYLNYSKYISQGPMLREWASAYNYKNIIGLYKSLISPKKVILGETNQITEDYIMTNSKHLHDKYMLLKRRHLSN